MSHNTLPNRRIVPYISIAILRCAQPMLEDACILFKTFGGVDAIAAAVAQAAMDSGVARLRVDPQIVTQHCHDFIYEGLLTPVPSLGESSV